MRRPAGVYSRISLSFSLSPLLLCFILVSVNCHATQRRRHPKKSLNNARIAQHSTGRLGVRVMLDSY